MNDKERLIEEAEFLEMERDHIDNILRELEWGSIQKYEDQDRDYWEAELTSVENEIAYINSCLKDY